MTCANARRCGSGQSALIPCGFAVLVIAALGRGAVALDANGAEPCCGPHGACAGDHAGSAATHGAVTCYPANLTKEELARLMERTQLLPPAMLGADTRYFTDSSVWTGDLSIGPSARAQPAHLTYSFPADGTTWGLSSVSATGPNDLNSRFTTLFGAGNVDRGRELLRQALGGWRRVTALTYDEVADDNVSMNQTTTRVSTRGDIRVGGLGFGTSSFLAYNAFPTAVFAGVGGSDMCINTSFFIAGAFNSSTNNYRYFRNTVAHEHGHGLGYIHTVPCNGVFLMEPAISTAFDMQTIDERRGGQRNYGDRFAGNNSTATAWNFGDLTSPSIRSVIELDLSTNGTGGFADTDEDWFRFTIGSNQNVTITATPTGGTYTQGQQSSSCSGSTSSIVASQAGNLSLELRDAAGTTVLQTSASGGAGVAETLTNTPLAAGTYTIRVFDIGPNANQTLQLYDLMIRVGTSKAPPQAIAGVNKRIAANANCFFMGNITSRVTEAGANITGNPPFDWDLDGDGTFEVLDTPQPNRQYPSNGVYNVTLRVTDSNGSVDTDTISVTVFGATTTVTSVPPSSGAQGLTVPVTINGTNLKNVTSASHVSVSGSGIAITGTPFPNALGTSVTGLSFVIDCNAPTGARNVTVSNADGTGTGVGVFTVTPAPQIAGDLDCNCIINSADAIAFALALTDAAGYASAYPGCDINRADINGNLSIDGDDLQEMVDLLIP